MPRASFRVAALLSGGAMLLHLAAIVGGIAEGGGFAAARQGAPWAWMIAPALATAVVVWLTVDAARQLGGTPASQWLSGVALIANPVLLRAIALSATAAFDHLWWTIALYGLLRLALDDQRGWWVLIALAGAAPMTLTVLAPAAFGAAGRGWPAPWPMGEVVTLGSLATSADARWRTLLAHGPVVALAVVGGWRFLRDRAESGVRAIGVLGVLAIGAGFVLRDATPAGAPVFPLLFAAGASWWSQRCDRWFGVQGRHGVYAVVALQIVWTLTVLILGR